MVSTVADGVGMIALEQTHKDAADLQWLAMLLTGNAETAADLTDEAMVSAGGENLFFSDWMRGWARRLVIAKALNAVRRQLAKSVRLTMYRDERKPEAPPRPWKLDGRTSRSDLERALLSIDVFPRAAVLLLLFEKVPLADAAVLLNVEPELVRKGQVTGVVELTMNLARMQGWTEEHAGRAQYA